MIGNLVIFVLGLFWGAALTLVLGALAASSKTDDEASRDAYIQAQKHYIEILERQVLDKLTGDE